MNGFAGHIIFDSAGSGGGSPAFLPIQGGRGMLAFAGRLDDRCSVVAALNLPLGTDDSDIAARAVERWGTDAPGRLLGDFALAVWFGDEGRLMLAGDAMGMRTVYYWRGPDRVLFATSLRSLLAMPGVPRAVDELFIADHLAMNYGDDEATFYRDIRKVRPGTCILLSALPLLLAGWLLLSRDIMLAEQNTMDLLFNLAGAWQFHLGRTQHVDFHEAVGPLNFLLTQAGFHLVGFSPFAFLAGQMLAVLGLSVMAVAAAWRRLSSSFCPSPCPR